MFYNRLGNDLEVEWSVSIEGVDDLSSADLNIYIICHRFKKSMDFWIEGSTIKFIFYGKDQVVCGDYDLQLVMNEGKEGQVVYDKYKEFNIYK